MTIEEQPVVWTRDMTVDEATQVLVEALVRDKKLLRTYVASVLRNTIDNLLTTSSPAK